MRYLVVCILLLFFIAGRVQVAAGQVVAAFDAPDTVCVGENLNILNRSSGAATYHWNFCQQKFSNGETEPITNAAWKQPAYMDYVQVNGNYHGFMTNYESGDIFRLDFGNSLLNTPQVVNLGDFNNTMPADGAGGIRVIQSGGNWYAFIVVGYPPGGVNPRLVRLSFGTNIRNPNPTATNLGNVGNMYDPRDLVLLQENGRWYGFTVNAETNTISRFDFSSPDIAVTGTSLGNIGGLEHPTGIYAHQQNGFTSLFITNGGANTRTGGQYSISRLDFEAGLNNLPVAINFGNAGNTLQHPRDITLMRECNNYYGLVLNAHPQYNDVLRLDMGEGADIVTTGQIVTAISNDLAFPYSYSPFTYEGNTYIGFIVSRESNSIVRLAYKGCTTASSGQHTSENPTNVAYQSPGEYTVELIVNKGLSTETSFCKKVFVKSCQDKVILIGDTTICAGQQLEIATVPALGYRWTTASGVTNMSSPDLLVTPDQSTTYFVEALFADSSILTDSIKITVLPSPIVTVNADSTICAGQQVQLTATGGTTYTWSPSTWLNNDDVANPIASPAENITYTVQVQSGNKCVTRASVSLNVRDQPKFAAGGDLFLCNGQSSTLVASGGDQYRWSPAPSADSAESASIVVQPATSTTYAVNILDSGCGADTTIYLPVRVSEGAVELPNAFTPNGDGKNDCFGLQNSGIDNVILFTIYNRWGNVVFQSRDITRCWDGSVNGISAPAGSYIYTIQATAACGAINRRGSITLIR